MPEMSKPAISLQDVKAVVERSIDLSTETQGVPLAVLRALREQGLLNKQDERELDALEKGIEKTAEIFHSILTKALGSNEAKLDRESIRAALEQHDASTILKLIDRLCEKEAAELKAQLAGTPEERAKVFDRIAERISEATAQSVDLLSILDILTLDPRNKALREHFDSSVGLLAELQDSARHILKDAVRRNRAEVQESLTDALSGRVGAAASDGMARTALAEKGSTVGVEKSSGHAAEGVYATAIERTLHTLRVRLAELHHRVEEAKGRLADTQASDSNPMLNELGRLELEKYTLDDQIRALSH
jgi:hypothetical protein